MVISSYVIDTLPKKCAQVTEALSGFEGVEIHGNENHRLIVTIEADSVDATYALATKLSQVDGVLTTNLVYCNFEDETLCN